MSDLVLPPDFDPEQYLEELDAMIQRIKERPLDQRWQEALEIVVAQEPEHCSAEEFAREHGL